MRYVMTAKKYSFYLSNPTFGIFHNCEKISATKAQEYIQELSNWHSIPHNSCLYSLSAHLVSHNSKKFSLTHNSRLTPKISKTNYGALGLRINLKTCKKCPTEKCFINICSGECSDDFVREIIGKKLFAEKYQGK